MPVAVKRWDDSHHHTPLRDLNMGPDSVQDRSAVKSRVKRTGGKPLIMDSGFIDSVGSTDPRKRKSRGRHKGVEQTRVLNYKTGEGDREQKIGKSVNGGNRSESDSDSVKLTVRERVQLLNSQAGGDGDGEGKSRGRSKVMRGWMKKRDQSAPPASNRNHVFQNQKSVPESVSSPPRRSRSIDRSRDRFSNQSNNVKVSDGKQLLNSQKPCEIKPSRNSAFVEVGRPSNFNRGPNAVSSASSPSMREAHFNPRSRMRDARTVKTFSKSLISQHKEDRGTSDSSLEKVTSVSNRDQTAGISVKRMVSFIHKGGLGNSNIARPHVRKREGKETANSESPSVYSSSIVDAQPSRQTPENLLSSSAMSSADVESLKTDDRPIVDGGDLSDTKVKVSETTDGSRIATTLVENKDNNQFPFHSQKTSTPDFGGLSNLNCNVEDRLTPTVLSLEKSPREETMTQESFSHTEQKNMGPLAGISNPGENSPFSVDQHQVYNLHYKSDSSSSHNKSEDNIKQVSGGSVVDPEWEEIVAKSYEVGLASSSSPKPGANRNVNTSHGNRVSSKPLPSKRNKSPSNYLPQEGDVDVFNKSMHPLDFALAIRDITEPKSNVRSSDRSFDGTDSPRDGIVFARRVPVRDETDGQLALDSHLIEEDVEFGAKDEDKEDDVFLPGAEKPLDKNDNTIRNKDLGEVISATSKSPYRRETYSSLTTVNLKSDGSGGGRAEEVSSSVNVSVEVDVAAEEDYVRINPSYKPPLSAAIAEIQAVKSARERRHLYREQKQLSSSPLFDEQPPESSDTLKGTEKKKVYHSTASYKAALDSVETEILAVKVSEERNVHQREGNQFSSAPSDNTAKLKAKSQIDIEPPSLEDVKPKVSANSPEVRRHHRLKIGHRRMPSKSSVNSTGSVSFHQSSHGSSSNEAVGHRRTRSRKSSVLSPTLSGGRSNPPPNDITVVDPNRSIDSSHTPRSSRSKAKFSRSNSEVSSSSSSSQSQLNRFFDMMGLESSVLSSILQPVLYLDDSMFQDMHTWRVGSSTNSSHSGGSFSDGSKVSADGVMNMKKLTKLPDQSQSIITKNARVIKWLVQCKKSQGVSR